MEKKPKISKIMFEVWLTGVLMPDDPSNIEKLKEANHRVKVIVKFIDEHEIKEN